MKDKTIIRELRTELERRVADWNFVECGSEPQLTGLPSKYFGDGDFLEKLHREVIEGIPVREVFSPSDMQSIFVSGSMLALRVYDSVTGGSRAYDA